MAAPVVTFNAGETIWNFTELTNTTGSTFLHSETHNAAFQDDNAAGPPPLPYSFTITFAHIPNPAVVPGSINVFGNYLYSSSGSPRWTGDIDYTFSVQDKLLDFLREGETRTQKIKVRINDSGDGSFVDTILTINVHGKNDTPVAKVDIKSTSEDTTTYKLKVTGNDKDPDIGDTLQIVSSSVFSVTSAAASFLSTSMVKIKNVTFVNDTNVSPNDSIIVTLDKAFQGLATGENALIVIKYTIVDDFGATSASEFRLTVTGKDDTQIVGTNSSDKNLFGEKNADKIFGLNGDDVIRPRGGHDEITGGSGKDKFIFLVKGDSSLADPDDIMDFVHGQDLIDLSGFAGTFQFRGKSAFNGGPDIRYDVKSGYLRVEVDTDGDKDADLRIDVHGVGLTSLVKGDFVL